jgi:hypothetical protein
MAQHFMKTDATLQAGRIDDKNHWQFKRKNENRKGKEERKRIQSSIKTLQHPHSPSRNE